MGIEVTAVRSGRELAAFVRLPTLLRSRSGWSPAAEAWTRALLSRRSNPYHRHAETELLLARKDGRLAGRLAAHVDHLCNRTVGEDLGTFSLLDCEPHPRVVSALLVAAERWLASRGARLVRGPLGPTMRLGCGLMVEGHGEPPTPGLDTNPPELPALVERAGYRPALDLTAHRVGTGETARGVVAAADRARRVPGVVVRPVRPRRLGDELARVLEVVNDLPGQGLACAPWSMGELRWTAARLAPIFDPDLSLLLEVQGEPAGLAVAIPNLREALGSPGPGRALLGAARVGLALGFRRIRSARVVMLTVRPGFAAAAGGELLDLLLVELAGRLRLRRIESAEVSLVDPTDLRLTVLLERAGARASKVYRLFEKEL